MEKSSFFSGFIIGGMFCAGTFVSIPYEWASYIALIFPVLWLIIPAIRFLVRNPDMPAAKDIQYDVLVAVSGTGFRTVGTFNDPKEAWECYKKQPYSSTIIYGGDEYGNATEELRSIF